MIWIIGPAFGAFLALVIGLSRRDTLRMRAQHRAYIHWEATGQPAAGFGPQWLFGGVPTPEPAPVPEPEPVVLEGRVMPRELPAGR